MCGSRDQCSVDASARVPALISRPAAEPSIHPGSTSSQQPKILLAFTILNAWVVSQVLVAPMDSDGAYDTASSGGSPDRREASASSGARTPSPAPPAKRTIDGEEACMSPALPAAPHSPFIMSNVNPGGTPEFRVASPSPLAGHIEAGSVFVRGQKKRPQRLKSLRRRVQNTTKGPDC